MTPCDFLLFSYISALPNHHKKSIFQQQMGAETETHIQSLCRELGAMEYLVLIGWLQQIPPLRAQGRLEKRRWKECKSQRSWRAARIQCPEKKQDQCNYELTETKAA